MVAWREEVEAAQPRPRAAVIEVPLLFESGLEHGFDATIAVIADEQTREARASARGHEALAERGERQLTQEESCSVRPTPCAMTRPPLIWSPSCRRSLTCCCDEPIDGHGNTPACRRHGDCRRRRVARRRRRSVLGVAAAIVALVVATMVLPLAKRVVNDLSLPIGYQDVIRQQAADKHLDRR